MLEASVCNDIAKRTEINAEEGKMMMIPICNPLCEKDEIIGTERYAPEFFEAQKQDHEDANWSNRVFYRCF